MLDMQQLGIARARMGAAPPGLTLYHGTNSSVFFSKLCMRSGFSSNEMFMGSYSLQTLGGTAIYGPGIYLTSSRNEAASYGSLIVKFEFETTTSYMDLTGTTGTAHAKAVGVPKQNLLGEARLYGLLKVTQQYYVMRSPYNCVVEPG